MEKLLRRLEQKFGRYAIPNIAAFLLAPKAAFFLYAMANPGASESITEKLTLVPTLVLQGEVWRLFTFIAEPPTYSFLWFVIYAYLLFLYCAGLQAQWGAFRLNMYLLFGWGAMVSCNFIAYAMYPAYGQIGGLLQLEATLMLAFATFYPNFIFNLFFILPVKVKYLAWIAVAFVLMEFLRGPWNVVEGYAHRVVILGIYGNYLLFFGPGLVKGFSERRSSSSRRRQFEDAIRRGHEQREEEDRREREEAER